MRLVTLVFLLLISAVPPLFAATAADVSRAPACSHCGMDRGKFNHSRMLIEYQDGSEVAVCSLHCAAVELANTIDRIPVAVRVADYETKELLDAEQAVWVIGGGKKGVMTAHAKWAFRGKEGAQRFIKENGGARATFDEAMKAAYDDMYQDTKMIREFRKMRRSQHQGGAH